MPEESVSLKEYFEKILIEKDKAINIALQAAEKAVAVAERNAEKWRDNANEWRQAMNDKDKLLMPRAEFLTYKETQDKAQVLEKERRDFGSGKGIGLSAGWGWAVAVVMFVIALFAFGARFT
jgi:hypothetical protein